MNNIAANDSVKSLNEYLADAYQEFLADQFEHPEIEPINMEQTLRENEKFQEYLYEDIKAKKGIKQKLKLIEQNNH